MSFHDVRNFQILFQYLQKAEPKRYDQFLRIHGFHLLANQVFLKILLLLPLLMMMMMMMQMKIFHDFSTPYEVKQVAFDLNLSTVCLLVLLVGRRKQG